MRNLTIISLNSAALIYIFCLLALSALDFKNKWQYEKS